MYYIRCVFDMIDTGGIGGTYSIIPEVLQRSGCKQTLKPIFH